MSRTASKTSLTSLISWPMRSSFPTQAIVVYEITLGAVCVELGAHQTIMQSTAIPKVAA